jgi:hypothetical protein
MKDAPLLANTIYMRRRRRRRMFHFWWRQILRKRLIFQFHHLHRDMQLGLGGTTHFGFHLSHITFQLSPSSWSFHPRLILSTSMTTYCFQRKSGAPCP